MNQAKTLAFMTMALGLLCLMYANIIYQNRPPEWQLQRVYTGTSARDLYVELPPHKLRMTIEKVACEYQPVVITYERMELTYAGTYFITNYCPAECGGSWSTSSGATCHRADWNYRYSEPTTCAIDLSVGSYGDLYYIPEFDRVFVAEDTGPGVRGYWLDLFYYDMEDIYGFPTGYYTVYSVEYITETVVATEDDLKYLKDMGVAEYYASLEE